MMMKQQGMISSVLVGMGFLIGLSGCASTEEMMRENPDPLRGYNRAVFAFNRRVDTALIKPVAKAYKAVTPEILDEGVTNFFDNLFDIEIAFNNILQLKFHDAAVDVSRLVFNTTFGLAGFFDVASAMGLPKHEEDFGQTLGYWTGLEGYYLVLPILGPSSTRDVFSIPVSYLLSPVTYVDPDALNYGLTALYAVDTRADLLRPERALGAAARDYDFVRSAYLQQRRNLVYDGNPPRLELDLDELDGNDSQL